MSRPGARILAIPILAVLVSASPSSSAESPPSAFSGPDYVLAGLDAGGAALWAQAAILFPLGILDSYGDESDGHFARTVAYLAYQPIRFGTESILELAAHRHYRGNRRVQAIAVFYPELFGFDADGFSGPTPERAREWVEGKSGFLYGFETRGSLGAWLSGNSRFLFSTRATSFRDDVAFYMGQGFSHAYPVLPDWPGSFSLIPGLSLGAIYSDAWSGPGEDDYENYNSVAFLIGPGMALEGVFRGIWTTRLDAGLEGGPVLHHRKFNHTGAGFENQFQQAFAVRARLQASAGLAF